MELDPRLHTGDNGVGGGRTTADDADGVDARRRGGAYALSSESPASTATPSSTSHITLPPPSSLPLARTGSTGAASRFGDANPLGHPNINIGSGLGRTVGGYSPAYPPLHHQAQAQAQAHLPYPSQAPPPPSQHHRQQVQLQQQQEQYDTTPSASASASPPPHQTHPHPHSRPQPDTGPGAGIGADDPYGDLKRPRACEACRSLKVRCEPDLNDPHGTCKRCAKARRTCVVTAPTRKRQKKTDSRVAELERKIDALTASLQASASGAASSNSGASPAGLGPAAADGSGLGLGSGSGVEGRQFAPEPRQQQQQEHPPRRWLGPMAQTGAGPSTTTSPTTSAGIAGSKRAATGEVKDRPYFGAYERAPSPPVTAPTEQPGGSSLGDAAGRHWQAPWGPGSRKGSTGGPGGGGEVGVAADVIERGLVSEEDALQAFNRYVTQMAPVIPMVVFQPGTTMEEVRRSKPLLFHAITSVAVGRFNPEAQVTLTADFYKIIAEKTVVKGEKSLELVQALLVTCNWYMVPDHFEELKFYQMTHLAVMLGIEIGMYRKTTSKNKMFFSLREAMHKTMLPLDPNSPEVRRAWLGCYFLAVQVTTSLRRAILVRWHPYMDECVEILENSPDALPSDKTMIQWAKLGHILEEINLQFSADDTGSDAPFSEPKVQYSIKVFGRQLEQWRKETRLDEHEHGPILRQAERIVDLYLHEGAMQLDIISNDSTAAAKDLASTAQMNALNTCLMACHSALDIILGIDIYDLICLPVVSQARTSFAMVALIKLYSIIAVSQDSIGQVIDLSSLRVEDYLTRVLKHYGAAGELPGGRTPRKFSVVLGLLQKWFNAHKNRSAELKEALAGGRPIPCAPEHLNLEENPEKYQSKPGQTPLHLLSEVAMGEPNSHPGNPNNTTPSTTYISSYNPPPPPENTSAANLVSPCQGQQSLPPASNPSTATPNTNVSDTWPQFPQPQPDGTRPYYPPFSSTTPTGAPTTTATNVTTFPDMTVTGYPDLSSGANIGMPGMNLEFFVPELGMQVGFNPENMLALERMMGDGFLNLPFPADAGMGYYS